MSATQPCPVGADVVNRKGRLLSLLSSGMKDRAIARARGVTERTVSRRISELMADLDVTTRFQAGVPAARRGWL